MALLKTLVKDGSFTRNEQPGDIVATQDVVNSLTTAGAGSISGALLSSTIINRTGPTGAVNDTLDTAANIIAALATAGLGDSYRVRYVNNVAFAITLAAQANTGVTVTNPVVNASSVKDFLVQITNPTPTSIAAAATTNGSAVITGMSLAQTSAVTPGQQVSGTGIAGGTTVLSVQPGVGVTLSANATATNALTALTFNPTVTILGIGQGLL